MITKPSLSTTVAVSPKIPSPSLSVPPDSNTSSQPSLSLSASKLLIIPSPSVSNNLENIVPTRSKLVLSTPSGVFPSIVAFIP